MTSRRSDSPIDDRDRCLERRLSLASVPRAPPTVARCRRRHRPRPHPPPNQSINQSIYQSILGASVDRPTDRPTDRSTDRSTDRPIDPIDPIDRSMFLEGRDRSLSPSPPRHDDPLHRPDRHTAASRLLAMAARSALLRLGRTTAFAPACATTTMTAIGARAYSTGATRRGSTRLDR